MKKAIGLVILMTQINEVIACPACEKQQPKILRGIVHGGVPESNWDYVIVIAVTIITLITLFFAIKWMVRPGEKEKSHIKHSPLIFE